MSSVVDLLGESVLNQKGESVPTATFCETEGRVVGLYFAALFDEASVAFTPLLADVYERIRETDRGKGFEIVYLSSDRDDESFNEFRKEMPWHAVPFANVDTVDKNVKRYKVREMPTLVLVEGSTGKLITTAGRDCISEDLDCVDFPWYPKAFDDVIGEKILSQGTLVDAKEVLKGKIKGLYFSAHWCPPCRIFTPQLATVYEMLRTEGKNFEVVFISSDRSQTSFEDYYKTMPWLAIPYKDPRVRRLTKRYEVGGIPTLIILDENNDLITVNGRPSVSKDPEGKEFPWTPPSVEELNESNATSLNESTCLILFTDGDEELINRAKDLLREPADQYLGEHKASANTVNVLPDLRFLYEGRESDEIADSIRTFAQLDGRKPLLAIVDVAERRTYSLQEENITRETIDDLISNFKNCKLDFVPITD